MENEETTIIEKEKTTEIQRKKPYVKKPNKNNLQVLVYEEQFLFRKRFSSTLSAIVTPWQRLTDDTFDSGIVVPYNRLFRVEKMYEDSENMSKYLVEDGLIHFDCVSKFTPEFFPDDANSGWIHFLSKIIDEDGNKLISIDDRMIIEGIEPIDTHLKQPSKIDFMTKNLKVFPIFFVNGFGLAVIEKDKAVLYLTVTDFSRLYCGVTNKTDFNNLIHNIRPVFPFFSITIDNKKSVVFLKLDGLKPFLNGHDFNSGLLRFEYSFENTNDLHVAIIGKCEE
jgi:hypothetical protein